ncbi:MAG: hypothetical protein M3033_15520 [Acidobacteriota bacterium]|nr:hypothetical protein [Acidobacteriota bacterium]
MSPIVVDLEEPKKIETFKTASEPVFMVSRQPKKRGKFVKFLKGLGILLVLLLFFGSIGGYFYWQHLKTTPQYSLALLIDAARRNDQKTVDEFVDADSIVDDFMPQITDKAVELYGKGLPPATIAKIEQVAAPVLPSVKLRARAEIPGLIREKTEKFNRIPFWAIALGAKRYLEITQEGDRAFIGSKLPESPLNLTLKRNGDTWKVVGVKDEELSRRIAEKIGQQIIATAGRGGIQKAGEEFGVKNLGEVIKQLDGIFK